MKHIALVLSVTTVAALAQDKPATVSTPPPAASGEWSKKEITPHFWAEGACVADVNKDGKMDILSGPFWYAGPEFSKRSMIYDMGDKSFVKKGDETGTKIPGWKGFLSGENEYSNNFISYAHDFNGDDWADYLVIGFPGKETFWWENPKGKDEPWQRHEVLAVTDNESPMFVDIDGDKKPDLLAMSNGTLGFSTRDASGAWKWMNVSGDANPKAYQKFTHGIGYGDINSDGRMDIIEGGGWWEQPANWDGKTAWKKHEAMFGLGSQQYGYDVNGDGKTDVITALAAHGWGVAWYEQTNDGGVEGWVKHLITGTDKEAGASGVSFSQPHAVDLVDMNGDGLKDIVTGKRCWAHGPSGDAEPNAPMVVYWFELKREGGKATYIPHLVDADSGVGTQVMATDVNGDGKQDVVVGNKKGLFVHTRK
jgi:hypothetical protein